VRGDVSDVDRVGGIDQRAEERINRHAGRQVQSSVLQVADARREPVAEERHHPEDMVGHAARIDRVLLGRQAGLVVEQAVEDVRSLAGGRGDHLGVERSVLVGDVSIEAHARLVAMPRVDIGERLAVAAGEEVLAVRR
jgi:hypothetical protein